MAAKVSLPAHSSYASPPQILPTSNTQPPTLTSCKDCQYLFLLFFFFLEGLCTSLISSTLSWVTTTAFLTALDGCTLLPSLTTPCLSSSPSFSLLSSSDVTMSSIVLSSPPTI